MTHPDHIEDLFSDLFDGTLTGPQREKAHAHLAECAPCRASYAAFEGSTGALRALRLVPTPPAHVDAIVKALAPALERTPPRRRLRPVLSHAASLALGLGLAWSLRGCGKAEESGGAEQRVVEVVREVPVEVVREVPVEVVREVPVERIEYLDRPIPNPLQLEVERGYALLAGIQGALSELAVLVRAESARREAAEAPPPAVRVPDEHRLADVPQRAARSPLSDSAPLRIVRGGDRVRIQTRGALAEIVPALIETLDDPDGSVARAAEQHLEALRAELAGEAFLPPLGAEPRRPANDRPGGLRGLLASDPSEPEEPAPDKRAPWTTWWLDRSATVAAAGVF